jgi:carbon-monoxide dehydrogenase small subunit
MTFTLNGTPVAPDADAGTRLLDWLREQQGLTGTKWACEIGRCGSCTVLVDGAPQAACLTMLWQVEGRAVTTIEGLCGDHPVQRAFAEAGAFQCGYCAPGMILSTVALLAQNPAPTEAETEAALAGNLCRCSGYMGVRRAVALLTGQAP